MNSWPEGYKRPLSQSDHKRWNRDHYPGTLQLCSKCGDATDRCEEDALFVEDVGPLCEGCYDDEADAANERGAAQYS